MRGVIVAITPDGTYGQLSADDGQRYSYWTSEVRNGHAQVGQMVDFQMWEGQPIDIFVLASPTPPQTPPRAGTPRPAARPGPGAQGAQAYAGQPAQYASQPAPYTPAPDRFGSAGAPSRFPPVPYWIKLFTSPFGRISRLQFWLHGVLPIVVGSILLGWIPLIGWLLSLAFMWGAICIGFKRFHDLGYPGWWSLLSALPSIAAAVVLGLGFLSPGMLAAAWLLAKVLWGLGLLIAIAQLLLVYIRVGQQGPNQYGEDPLGG